MASTEWAVARTQGSRNGIIKSIVGRAGDELDVENAFMANDTSILTGG
jgi:hypothetical protein